MGYSPWDHKESDTTEETSHAHKHRKFQGKPNYVFCKGQREIQRINSPSLGVPSRGFFFFFARLIVG